MEGASCYIFDTLDLFLVYLGTQWSEFYWKEQTVMLLMQEHDFPQGQSADFCSR